MEVVLNKCFGGFGLSKEAVLWLREHGDEKALKPMFKGESYENGTSIDWEYPQYYVHSSYNERNNPLLIECVKTLGDAANGSMARLVIVDVPEDGWEMDDYDGIETIHEYHRSW